MHVDYALVTASGAEGAIGHCIGEPSDLMPKTTLQHAVYRCISIYDGILLQPLSRRVATALALMVAVTSFYKLFTSVVLQIPSAADRLLAVHQHLQAPAEESRQSAVPAV